MFTATGDDWADRAASLSLHARMFIEGAWVEGSAEPLAPVSPRDGRALPQITAASAADVDRAVRSARAAFDAGVWSRIAPRERGQLLIAFAQRIHDNAEELALIISLEMGKPIREALQTELRAVVNCFRWYGEAADKVLDEMPVTAPNSLALVTREPAGVVAAVVPWNFPLTMTAWKLAPALAVGNSVVLKPAEHTTFSALRLAELAFEAGIPAGVLNVTPGAGHIAGRALGEHSDVDVVTFTGSPEVGRKFLGYAAASNGKRVWPELGGKTASLVLPDADLERAVRATADGCFYNQGQMCTASSRLLVPRAQRDRALEIAAEVARTSLPADPFDVGTSMGAIVSEKQLAGIAGFVERAQAEGAELAAGSAERFRAVDGGSYFAPVVLGVTPAHEVAQREVFGPVLSVIAYDDVEDALAIANGTEFGLAAALWSTDLNAVHTLSRRLRAGVVWVNCFEEGDMTIPFGGVKGSGFGRDKSLHAMEKFTDLKTTWIELS
ncbi:MULTISPECIES: aldehyde dehydrogenase family protein [unclassified Microbacterium]|uniref:aldehyde dehydrogenase family protein n=1 Tax=unclassified Microbacterium TaxID=2609290 RepID=UPI0016054498|nr:MULTISPECIES: aldehyde dehydrogenase family protein [unclassified Microbacterium]QNA94011.1 aldehyde dehydrogenase family protein [Microbacterium sp. Se63.02b]QYM64342.1 aldehyde dehydrogenase family protein [Microbacterium sp. Se5.02b]